MTYVFKRPFRQPLLLDARDTLDLRKQCREIIGRRRSARLRYKQIGSNSFRIERHGLWSVADVYAI